jgi:hypothetical protein
MGINSLILVVSALVLIGGGCISPSSGTLVIQLTGHVTGVEHLYITVSEIKVKNSDETRGGVKIDDKPQTIDLFSTRNSAQGIGHKDLATGKYTQISLKVEEATAVIDEKNIMLEISDEDGQYINVEEPFEIEGGKTTKVIIELDGDKSVTETEDRSVLLACGMFPKVYRLTPFV